jgi:hypothetical protein
MFLCVGCDKTDKRFNPLISSKANEFARGMIKKLLFEELGLYYIGSMG